MSTRVTLYTRPGCHLCDEARETVARVCAELGEGFEEVDVDTDPELRERFTEEVPVTFVDGRQHDFWRVDEQRLRVALSAGAAADGGTYVFVINSFLAGGAERSLLELLPRLVERGIRPVVACLRRGEVGFEDEVRQAGFDVRILDGGSLPAKVRSLRRLIREERPALVHTTLFDADVVGRLAAVRLGVPVVTSLVNTTYDPARLADPHLTPWRLRLVQRADALTARRLTDHFHAISDAVKDSAVETMGLDPDRISVVRRGRDEGRLGRRTPERRRRAREELGLGEHELVVLTVGRQEFQKGQRHLVEAMPGVLAAHPDARLLVLGREGNASGTLAGAVAASGVASAITLLGHRSDVSDVMAAADVFVFPSIYEGLGGALIEALALSLPVVASDLPALREVVVEGENALLVPPGDAAALERALVSLLADPERRHSFGERSRELFETRFRIEDATAGMVELLGRVSGSAASRHRPA